jgi:hypothetical protein
MTAAELRLLSRLGRMMEGEIQLHAAPRGQSLTLTSEHSRPRRHLARQHGGRGLARGEVVR